MTARLPALLLATLTSWPSAFVGCSSLTALTPRPFCGPSRSLATLSRPLARFAFLKYWAASRRTMASGCGLKRPQVGQWHSASGGNASACTRRLSCSAMSACFHSAHARM
eukprot:3704884-Alexandrium_andersonii.AAC.1